MKRSRFVAFAFLAAGLAVVFIPWPAPAAHPAERVIRVEAKSFAYTPAQIPVNPGDRVTIELVSTDVVHGLYIDGYGLSVQADPGQTATLTFTADRPGSFRFRCNVTCGTRHPFMIGRLNVGVNRTLYRGLALALLAVVGVLIWPRERANS